MSRLAEQALAGIRSLDPLTVQDGCLLAMSFFELRRGPNVQPADPAVRDDPATDDQIEAMRRELMRLAKDPPHPDLPSAALSALGELYDPALVPFFVARVRQYRDCDPGAMYQAMIALDNLDQRPFDEPSGWSVHDVERNRAMADRYLKRVGPTEDPGCLE